MNSLISYWNPIIETLPYKELKKLQLKKFKRIFNWAYNNSKFHRDLYRENKICPDDIQSIEDIRFIPKIDKELIGKSQNKSPYPYGNSLCVPIEEVTEFHQTSGTTGYPLYQADSQTDWEWWAESWAYILWAQGYRPQDKVFIPFGYNQFIAFWAGHYAAEKIGCEVIPGGALNTKGRISKIKELLPTAIMGTPTNMLNMAETALVKMSIDLSSLSVNKITCAGEPGASIPATKNRIEKAWGAKVFDHAGATEIGAWSYECELQPGGLHINEAFFLVEIEDLETGKIINEPGKRGKMIITAFDRVSQPCIRYDSKDIIEWHDKQCHCGRTFRMIKGGVIGRTDDLIKVKGVLLSPMTIENIVRSIDSLGDNYEVIVDNNGVTDKITLNVECFNNTRREYDIKKLKEVLQLKTNLNFDINAIRHGSLPRYEVKANRVKDLRNLD